MKILSGIDLVYLPKFKRAAKSGGENFLKRVFHETELIHLRGGMQHLAGIFAAKEAVIKALSLPPDSWHDIVITYNLNGAPKVALTHHPIKSLSLSISHSGNYVIAQVLAVK